MLQSCQNFAGGHLSSFDNGGQFFWNSELKLSIAHHPSTDGMPFQEYPREMDWPRGLCGSNLNFVKNMQKGRARMFLPSTSSSAVSFQRTSLHGISAVISDPYTVGRRVKLKGGEPFEF